MRAGIVMMSALRKHNNWNANHYLGFDPELDPAIRRARKTLGEAQERIKRLLEERAEDNEFRQQLIDSGELVVLGEEIEPDNGS